MKPPDAVTSLPTLTPGDQVWLFSGTFAARVTVTRITKTLVVVGERRFWKRDGRERFGIGRIAIGPEAGELGERLLREQERERARQDWWSVMGRFGAPFSPRGVAAVRAACDVAERALKATGEWRDA